MAVALLHGARGGIGIRVVRKDFADGLLVLRPPASFCTSRLIITKHHFYWQSADLVSRIF